MAGNRIIEFVEEGVKFILPPELDYVFVERLEPERVEGDNRFSPNRDVIQVLIFKKENLDADIPKFDQKLKLLVNFNQEDLDHATSNNQKFPVLGIYDGKRWHTPGDTEGKVTYGKPFSAGRWVGSAELEIDAWDDPAIGWGP